MNHIRFYFIIIFFATIVLGCSHNKEAARAYFTIDPKDRKVSVPIYLNDSIPANFFFDTGGQLVLDSALIANHPSILENIPVSPDTIPTGSGWSKNRTPGLLFKNISQKLEIGNFSAQYTNMTVFNYKKNSNNPSGDEGIFNIPPEDSVNVWELNFDYNYLEVHNADGFKMPENTITYPLLGPKNESRYFVKLPLKIQYSDGDTLAITKKLFFIDLGMAWDIALNIHNPEIGFFEKRTDAVWTKFLDSYSKHYKVKCTLSDNILMDSLRIYTYNFYYSPYPTYIIGLNFLKRFNVFFDMKNRRLGLQPVKRFQRVINPLHPRYYYNIQKSNTGKYIITDIADYKENYFKIAGLRKGDEVIKINEMPVQSVTSIIFNKFLRRDIMVFDLKREGNMQRLTVKINRNEKQGD
ncbi:MAG: tight junction protein ZO-3 [Ignavibacteria bacterium]|nr:tight junction protein ZO-3 [Ignavibacteria bacterium]